MNSPELTPSSQSGYDEYMDPNPAEEPRQSEETISEILPGPVTKAGKSLHENAEKGTEGDVAPSEAKEVTHESMARDAANKADMRPTRERLVGISREIIRETDPREVIKSFKLVESWSVLVERGLDKNLPEEELKKFQAIRNQVKEIAAQLNQEGDRDKGLYYTDMGGVSAADRDVLTQRSTIADVAGKMKDYFEKAKLIERIDYFKPVASFEELMVKIADFTTRDEFRPGGKHQLLEIEETIDKFGRKIILEKAHPENFIHWMRDQLEFFHDFSPTTNISLFQDISIPTAARAISLGEILYGATSDTYFSHRVPKVEEVMMSESQLASIASSKPDKFTYIKSSGENHPGTYIIKNDDGTVEVFTLDPVLLGYDDMDKPVYGYKLLDKDGKPSYGIDPDKEKWNTEKDPGYDRAKNDVLWEAFLLTNFHNYSVTYRIQAMQSEGPLKEKMAEVFGLNMMTDSRERLLRLFRMQSADKPQEAQDRIANDHHQQGSVGKAMQRSLAGYYHLSEASATASGYKFEKGSMNAFTEVMRGKSVEGGEEFYKGLINLTLENEFRNEIAGIKELVDRLNKQKISGRYNNQTKTFEDDLAGESLRDREDWEKVQLSEVAFLGRQKLFEILRNSYRITEETFDQVYKKLEQDLQNGYDDAEGKHHEQDGEKLDQLRKSGNREAVLRLFIGKNRVNDDLFKQKGQLGKDGKPLEKTGYMREFIDGGWDKLDFFAVKFLSQTFANASSGGFTDDANIWSNISYDHRAIKRVRQAMRHAISQTEKLSDFESLYAEEWAYVLVYQTGISARNDMNGIGHDAWSKIQNTAYYRLRQTGGGNYPGNLDNLYGINRIGVNVWEGLKVQRENSALDTTLYEVLTGLTEKNGELRFNINDDVGTFDFYGNAERQFYADHMSHAIDLFVDITQKPEFNFDKVVKHDNYGRLVWNNEEMQKMIDSTWKHLRYGFDNRAFLYDKTLYGWWYDETIEYDEKNGKVGTIKRSPRFGFKSLRDLMFSEKVREMNMYGEMKNGKYKSERKDLSGWTGENAYHTKMGRNVFAYLIAAQLREHTRYGGGYRIYSAEEVEMITKAFINYAARVMQGENGETLVLSGFFSPEEIMRILIAGHAILWMLYAKEYSTGFAGGFLFGLFEAFALVMQQVGAGIKL